MTYICRCVYKYINKCIYCLLMTKIAVLSLYSYSLNCPPKHFLELSEVYVNHVTTKHSELPLSQLSLYMALVVLWSITPPPTSCCPVSYSLIGCRLLLMYFSVRTNFTQQDFELQQVKIFSMPNILWVSAILSDCVIDNSHCVISHEQASFCL